MSKRDPAVPLRQILAHAREAVELCQTRTRADLDNDRLLNLALTRLLEIIGEAAYRVPESVRDQHQELPWMEMIASRNRLIHGYDSVDFDILWSIIQKDLPILVNQLESILGETPSRPE